MATTLAHEPPAGEGAHADGGADTALRVLVVAPLGRTAAVTCDVLRAAGIACDTCTSLDALVAALPDGAGAVLLLEEALHDADAVARFAAALDAQPAWSDLSVTVFVDRLDAPLPAVTRLLARGADPLAGRSVVALERPVAARTLVALVASALRDRQRQYRVRDHLAQAAAATRAAEAASAAKGAFLSRMAHELRTPLNAIQGHAQLVALGVHGPVTEAQAEALARVGAAQQRLVALVDGLLDLARIESGRMEFRMAATPVDAVLDTVLPLVETQAAARRITIARGDRDARAVAWADARRLEQVLLNLLANAVKFTPEGGDVAVTVEVRVRDGGDDDASAASASHDAGTIRIHVADTGPGVPADQRTRIFEPFRRADSDASRAAAGTGLGLAISRDLMRGMGGALRVGEAPGGGAVFTAVLRRADPAQTAV